ncbi:hypothetical protein GHT06_018486 [Daphnia sinensis]|uniref:Uncharacterized protein n=1 Tax=Daphnia sinensis TaxID=1820382 RepID=A0AAD5PT68_9CRUS|nr:hypothetical protein GHT06_018486 [Daphnia sinensis]
MKINIKPLTGKEFELKHLILKKRNMPGAQHQRLVHLGKTFSVTEGSKIHLFTKKIDDGRSDGLAKRSGLDIVLFNALKSHLSKEDIDKVLTEFNKELQTAFTNYRLNDIEQLAVNLLR